MFDEAFLNNLPSDPYEAVKVMCDKFFYEHNQIVNSKRQSKFYNYIEAFAAMEAFINATGLDISSPGLNKPAKPAKDIDIIINFFSGLDQLITARSHELTLDGCRDKYAKMFGTTFVYQFSEGDISRIQELLNELRDTITESELFDAKHKQRILKKLEKLQAELHKKMSNLDGFWGLIGDAGVVLGKFGKDAKPLVDRILEIEGIVWRTQVRAEELPSGATLPLLSDGKQEDK